MAAERFRISVLSEAQRLKQVVTEEKQRLEIQALIHELNAVPFDVHRLYNVMRRLRSLRDELRGKVDVKLPSFEEVREVAMSIMKGLK
ncbi:MAG: hypothetical protein QXK12_08485 [Candidatus Nezhaarchaeales archaeon]